MDAGVPAGRSEATYLVERYWPGVDEAMLRSALPRLERAARAMTGEGVPVDHMGSLLVPADQVVFSVIRAESEQVVREVNDRARMPVDRVAVVTWQGFGAPIEATRRRRRSGTNFGGN